MAAAAYSPNMRQSRGSRRAEKRARERKTDVCFWRRGQARCATIYCSSTRRLTNYDITLDEFLGADLPAAHHLSLWCVFACQESLNLLLSLSRGECETMMESTPFRCCAAKRALIKIYGNNESCRIVSAVWAFRLSATCIASGSATGLKSATCFQEGFALEIELWGQ